MNANTMIKLERSTKFHNAIQRCKALRPRAIRVNDTTVHVTGSCGAVYTVTLAQPQPGLLLGSCDCKAGQAGFICYHLVAAYHVPCTVLHAPVMHTVVRTTQTAISVAAWLHAQSACEPQVSPAPASQPTPVSIPAGVGREKRVVLMGTQPSDARPVAKFRSNALGEMYKGFQI